MAVDDARSDGDEHDCHRPQGSTTYVFGVIAFDAADNRSSERSKSFKTSRC